ncbi:hypothetical protein FISHEDRAFT_70671 [Fistulina hepatica ATCC 64428]|uniref:Uncharacterized protein n=1 Tax=Fistulina hepatica ATCC 64428 TaxID=1128425 RepID=A0A0D7AKX5_9AGAR|nr:hypothetical protein FISHEDRAFT_70671 [Fistulina hepatica ATCC 64428]
MWKREASVLQYFSVRSNSCLERSLPRFLAQCLKSSNFVWETAFLKELRRALDEDDVMPIDHALNSVHAESHDKRDGVDDATIIRLTKFHELNSIRIIFPYMMTVPLMILGDDGLTRYMYVNSSSFLTGLFFIIAALGYVISSGITLDIFLPRSTDTEIRMHESRRNMYASRASGHVGTSSVASMVDTPALQHVCGYMTDVRGTYMLTMTPGRPALVKSAPLSPSDMVDRDGLPHILPPSPTV